MKAVLESLHMVLEGQKELTFNLIRTAYTDTDIERQIYENELDGLSKKEERIKNAYLNGIDTMDEYKRNKEMIEQRRKELQRLLANLKSVSLNPEDYKEQFLSRINSTLEIIESAAPYELKGEALRSIVQKIVLHKDTDSLEFYYFLTV